MSSKAKNLQPPEQSKGDIAHTIARAGLSTIPVAGGPAVELFTLLITPPLEKRRAEWMENVANILTELQERNDIDLVKLQSNDVFIDTVLRASQVALKNSQREKLEALKNAVANSALPNPPDESLQQIFLGFVDNFTVWHLKILDLFQDPQKWAQKNEHQFPNLYMGGLSNILESAFPEMSGKRNFYDQIWKDLYLSGLVKTEGMHTSMDVHSLMARWTTEMGDQFIKFMTA